MRKIGDMTSSTAQSQPQPLSFEEEAIKRNTDCVYFLASPLTCKKGSECDYRHSEVTRLNPRDCWFWQTSSCLNPKCAFRHPPLDGLLGNQAAPSTGSSSSTPRPSTTAIPLAPSSTAVPCVFFKKGYCMKGDWCPFLHVVPSSSGSKAPVAALAAETATGTAGPSGTQKRVLNKNVLSASAAKPITTAPQEKATNGVSAPRSNAFSVSDIDDTRGHRPTHLISNGNPVVMPDRAQQLHHLGEREGMNSKGLEEVSREPSPGFDVLVDDVGRDSHYYAGDDRYGMPGEHEATNDLDIGRSNDYSMISGIDDERHQDSMAYDPHEYRHLASERHQAMSERMSGGSYYDNNPYNRPRTFSQIDDLNLRHRLMKHKRPSSLRSVINHELSHDVQNREKGYQDERHGSLHDNRSGSRLRGRIELPRRSSPGDTALSRGADHNGSSYLHGRMRGMMNSWIQQPFTNSRRDHGVFHGRRDAPLLDNNGDFPAPKSLSELKNGKTMEPDLQTQADQQFGKRKRVIHDEKDGGSDLSFEGPKSLQEILKRKRGEANGIASSISSANDEVTVKDAIDTETKFAPAYEEEEKPGTYDSVPTDAGMVNSDDNILVEDGVEAEENGEDYDLNQEYEDDPESYTYQDTDAIEGNYIDGKHDNADDYEDDDDFCKEDGRRVLLIHTGFDYTTSFRTLISDFDASRELV